MAGNVIYRGPIKDEPETVSNLTVAGAYLPGILVTASASALTVATASDMKEQLLVLSNRNFYDQDITTAYASGDTGVAYRPRPNEIYQVRLANATYALNDPLTIGASGYLTAATNEDVIYAYFADTAGAFTAGALADVRWGTGITVEAA